MLKVEDGEWVLTRDGYVGRIERFWPNADGSADYRVIPLYPRYAGTGISVKEVDVLYQGFIGDKGMRLHRR